ncbi:MAG: DUF2889 domain-containing protein [Sphingobium sp.]
MKTEVCDQDDAGAPAAHVAVAPGHPAELPPREPGTVRRTSSIDVHWPEGWGGRMTAVARGRDLATLVDDRTLLLGEAAYEADLDPERRIIGMAGGQGCHALVGERAGSRLRAAIARELPEERRAGTLLYLLLDDMAGASLVAPWAWSQWDGDWDAKMAEFRMDPRIAAQMASKENICSGLRSGSSGLDFGAGGSAVDERPETGDAYGWHALPALEGATFRRARRIDVSPGPEIRIDAHFRDSARRPDGGRSVVHEYRLLATADSVSQTLSSITAEPRVLPFPECVPAAVSARLLIGKPLAGLREIVLEMLKGPIGCTHLNDALRALAEVPVLADQAGQASVCSGGVKHLGDF